MSAPGQVDGGNGHGGGIQTGTGNGKPGGKDDDAGKGSDDLPDGGGDAGSLEGLVADLTPAELKVACKDRDKTEGLVGNLERACRAEAYLFSTKSDACLDNLDACNGSGSTSLALEEPSACALGGVDASDCVITIAEMRDCSTKLGAFWLNRTCAEDKLLELMPECIEQLSLRCPSLYGTLDTGSGGGVTGGTCSGLSEPCVSQNNSFDCSSVGCSWSAEDNTCTGVSIACSAYDSDTSCLAAGCLWDPV